MFTSTLIVLALLLPGGWVTNVAAWAGAVGLLGTVATALLANPRWKPNQKRALQIGFAVLFGLASYVVQSGINGDFANPGYLVGWLLGAYGAINLTYVSLKSGMLDKLENKGVGASDPTQQPGDDNFEELNSLPADPYNGNSDQPPADPNAPIVQ